MDNLLGRLFIGCSNSTFASLQKMFTLRLWAREPRARQRKNKPIILTLKPLQGSRMIIPFILLHTKCVYTL